MAAQIKPCIPGRRSRGKPVRYDKRRYRRRNRIEIMFGRSKDWRRIATRCDWCPKVFLSASTHVSAPRRDRHLLAMMQERDAVKGLRCALPVTACKSSRKLWPFPYRIQKEGYG